MPKLHLRPSSGALSTTNVMELSLDVTQIQAFDSFDRCLLRLPLELRPTGQDYDLRLFSANAYLFLGNQSLHNSPRPWTNRERIAASDPFLASEYQSDIAFLFPISRLTLETVERERNGQDLLLTLAVDCILCWKSSVEKGFLHADSAMVLTISRSDWQDKMLQTWGYMTHHVVMWSSPASSDKTLQKVQLEYKKAEDCFLQSDWEGTLVAVRKCYESLPSIQKLDLQGEKAHFDTRLIAFRNQILTPMIGATRAAMVSELFKSQRDFVSAPTKSGSRPVDRGTASLALKIASLVLGYIIDSRQSSSL